MASNVDQAASVDGMMPAKQHILDIGRYANEAVQIDGNNCELDSNDDEVFRSNDKLMHGMVVRYKLVTNKTVRVGQPLLLDYGKGYASPRVTTSSNRVFSCTIYSWTHYTKRNAPSSPGLVNKVIN